MIKQQKISPQQLLERRLTEKCLAKHSKFMLKQQQKPMKKLIKEAQARARQPEDSLQLLEQRIDTSPYSNKREKLLLRKQSLLNSMSHRQKEIEMLLTENRRYGTHYRF